ncbi:MAG: hypothetical protein E6G97_18165 [Alphaproteobacteria bacterium]|nr:MAG: hypothetical protein E6G97_18165 [Alphaproteobacteria bacterium]
MKLKDKTAADIVATWYRLRAQGWRRHPVALDNLRSAMLALEGPDLPEELIAWQAAVEAERQMTAELDADNMVPMLSAFRFVRANQALIEACAEGVTVDGD